MRVFVFPGQGSQRRGMGEALFDSCAEFHDVENQLDVVLGYSIRSLCIGDPEGLLNDTRYTQPALYIVNALHYYQATRDGVLPDAAAGHSLGEYNALLAGGAFDLMTGLRLVKRRGELMSRVRGGGMTAVVGLSADVIASVLRDSGMGDVEIANYNAPLQSVISGKADQLKLVVPMLEAAGARLCVPLPVSAAFHSRQMADVASAFRDFLGGFEFRELQLPVIANVTGEPYPLQDPTETIRSMLIRQIQAPVRWVPSMQYVFRLGANEIREIGPGQVLARLTEQCRAAA